jgi:hypothetical protein
MADLQENMSESTSGNISTPIAPGGTSVEVANDTSVSEDIPEPSTGTVSDWSAFR